MSERFFEIEKEYCVYKEYFEWLENLKIFKIKWQQFKMLEGIESDSVGISQDLIIVPTQNDLNKFGRFLCKDIFNGGGRKFKKTSLIQKDWEKFIENNNVKLLRKPEIFFDFSKFNGIFGGRISTRIFHYQDKLVCSVNLENSLDNYEPPEGYKEIKGSEFFTILEKVSKEENNGETNH